MELKDKLKKLRLERGMTQEAAADFLGVSAQTVSKWERGLLSPYIGLLPRIALLYQCTIDSLFDMGSVWSIEHRQKFRAEIHRLYEQKDWEGIYQAWIREIERDPDAYRNYPDVMLHVFRKKLYDRDHVEKMISLADRAEKRCTNDDIRNEIYRVMLQICSESDDRKIREKGKYYYGRLPLLRHSREIYAKYGTDGEEYRAQIRRNLLYLADLSECSVRQLILPDMPPEEKLYYYQKAAAILEIVLDGTCAGLYDPPLLSNYARIAALHASLGRRDLAAQVIDRIRRALEKHMTGEREGPSRLLDPESLSVTDAAVQMCRNLLKEMLETPELEPFREELAELRDRYNAYFDTKEKV